MYLLIFEDGEIGAVSSVCKGTLAASDGGFVEIVDMSKELIYSNGDWTNIKELDEEE